MGSILRFRGSINSVHKSEKTEQTRFFVQCLALSIRHSSTVLALSWHEKVIVNADYILSIIYRYLFSVPSGAAIQFAFGISGGLKNLELPNKSSAFGGLPGRAGSDPVPPPGKDVCDSRKPVRRKILFLCKRRSLFATEPLLKEAFLVEKSCRTRQSIKTSLETLPLCVFQPDTTVACHWSKSFTTNCLTAIDVPNKCFDIQDQKYAGNLERFPQSPHCHQKLPRDSI